MHPYCVTAHMKKFLFVLALAVAGGVQAQDTIPDGTRDNTLLRIQTLPYYSFGKGVGITSPDSIYQLNIRFRMQNRATFMENDAGESSIDAQIRRLRLRLDGYVGNPKITYAIQLSFAPGDVGEIREHENINIIRDAVVWYQPNNKWTIGFGQTKLPGNRQRFNSSGALQLTDRSINNARFNIDRDFGLQVHQLNMYRNKFSYSIKTAITMGEGRNFTSNNDHGLAYTGKVELYPMGAFASGGEYFEGDLKREQKPKLMLSGAYQFNDDAKKTGGQLGEYLYDKKDLHTVLCDLMFKYRGWALMSSYMSRNTASPLSYNPADSSKFLYVYAGQGMDFQGSYLTKSHFEFIGRYSFQNSGARIAHLAPDTRQYTIGLTKYIWEHAFKLQTELTYETRNYFNGTSRDSWYIRFQVEIGI